MKAVHYECPSCGAPLAVHENMGLICCEYCGTTVDLRWLASTMQPIEGATTLPTKSERLLSPHEQRAQQKRLVDSQKKLHSFYILRILSILATAASFLLLQVNDSNVIAAILIVAILAWIGFNFLIRSEQKQIQSILSKTGSGTAVNTTLSATGQDDLKIYKILHVICIVFFGLSIILVNVESISDFWAGMLIVCAIGWILTSSHIRFLSNFPIASGISNSSIQPKKSLKVLRIACIIVFFSLLVFVNYIPISEQLWGGLFLVSLSGWIACSIAIRRLLQTSNPRHQKDEASD